MWLGSGQPSSAPGSPQTALGLVSRDALGVRPMFKDDAVRERLAWQITHACRMGIGLFVVWVTVRIQGDPEPETRSRRGTTF